MEIYLNLILIIKILKREKINVLYNEKIVSCRMLKKLSQYESQSPYIPYIYAAIGNVTIVLMQSYVKVVSQALTPFYALFVRGLLLLVVNTIVVRINHIRVQQNNREVHGLLIKRSIFSSSALTSFMSTVAFIPIGIANSLFNTGPIFIHFLQALYHNKKVNKVHLCMTVLCFIGVLLIIKPAFVFGQAGKWPIILMILPVFGAFCNSLSMLFLHQLKGRVSNLIALQYFYIAQTFLTGFLQNFKTVKQSTKITYTLIFPVIGMVFFAYVTQNLITRAIYLKKASYIMPFGYISIVVAFAVDILFFQTQFDWLSIVGMAMTSVGLLSKLCIKEENQ